MLIVVWHAQSEECIFEVGTFSLWLWLCYNNIWQRVIQHILVRPSLSDTYLPSLPSGFLLYMCIINVQHILNTTICLQRDLGSI